MAATPTVAQLTQQIKQGLEAKLGVSIPGFGKVFLNALAAVQAAKLKLLYLLASDIQKNIWVDTAYSITQGGTLERFGLVKIGRNPFTATQGEYTVNVTGQIGDVVPANTVFKADDNSLSPGALYVLDVEKTLVSANDTMDLRALEAGLESSLEVGNTLTSIAPLVVNDQVSVSAEIQAPLAAEDLEEYRQVVLRAFQNESQGGSAGDYRTWASDAQGVAEVYPYAKSGECAEINLFVEATKADSDDGFGTPTTAILENVAEVVEFDPDTTKPLNERGRRPLGTFQIFTLPVSVKPVDIVVVNPVNFDTDTETAIEASVSAYIDTVRPFVDSADILENKNDILSVNNLIFVIQNVLDSNQSFETITFEVDSVTVPVSIQFENGDIPYLQSITF